MCVCVRACMCVCVPGDTNYRIWDSMTSLRSNSPLNKYLHYCDVKISHTFSKPAAKFLCLKYNNNNNNNNNNMRSPRHWTTAKWYPNMSKPMYEQERFQCCGIKKYTEREREREVTANRQDIIIKNKKEKTCVLIDVAIPADRNVVQKEAEMKLMYKTLCIKIQRMWNLKCKIIPVIIGATGIVTKGLRKNLEATPG